jgi:hypothetical protein
MTTMRKRQIRKKKLLPTLPNELWYQIFPSLIHKVKDDDCLHDILGMRLVCYKWNVMINSILTPYIKGILLYMPPIITVQKPQMLASYKARAIIAELMSYKNKDNNLQFAYDQLQRIWKYLVTDQTAFNKWMIQFLTQSDVLVYKRIIQSRLKDVLLCWMHVSERYQRTSKPVPYIVQSISTVVQRNLFYIYVIQHNQRLEILNHMIGNVVKNQ